MKNKHMRFGVVFVVALLAFTGCKKEEVEETITPEEQALMDDQLIQDYLEENNITDVIKHASGLYYKMQTEGSGGQPTIYSTVMVYYTGKFLNGEVFDDNDGRVATFPLQGVIKGWQIGIPLIKKKGVATFYIPSGLAYGPQGRGSIPPNEVLVFEDVYLYDFN
jgi:FKBP-type peptidyl-prolyl cis-trans isomerase